MFDTDAYRKTPTNEGVDTCVLSREKLNRNRNEYRKKVYDAIYFSKIGATCDEIELMLNMRHQTASCMITFLKDDGFVCDSGLRRNTRTGRKAIVWVIAKKNENQLRLF